jgi:6-phosphogluconolactonase
MKKQITTLLLALMCCSIQAQDNIQFGYRYYTKGCESKGIYVYDYDVNTGFQL